MPDLMVHFGGARGELPGGLTFEHLAPGQGMAVHQLIAHHPDAPPGYWGHPHEAGRISWEPGTDQVITNLSVHPDFQRLGLATELFRRAREISPAIRHDTGRMVSPQGKNWISAISLLAHFGAWDPAVPLYHGSLREIGKGTVLTPGSRDPDGSVHSGDYVYATTSPESARYFASMHDFSPQTDVPVYVHRVEPVGDIEPHNMPGEDERFAHGNYRAKALRVVDHYQAPSHYASLLAHFGAYSGKDLARMYQTGQYPEHMYHSTPARNRHSIAEHGLGVDYGDDEDPYFKGVYVTPTEPKHGGEDIWRVHTKGLHFKPDDWDNFSEFGGSYLSREDIPPHHLELWHQGGHEPREALLAHFGAYEGPPGEGFPNPYHGTARFGGRDEFSHTWFHGTRGTPEFGERKGDTDRMAQRPDERAMTSGWPQPNKLLGVHLSPLHEVAHGFVGSVSSQHGALVHARLHFANPAHYPTEDHLNLAVAQWADRHYPHWHDDKLNGNLSWQYSDNKGTRRNWHEEHLPGGEPNPHGLSDDELAERNWGEADPDKPRYFDRVAGHAQQVLQWHPHLPEIVHGFNSHLRAQGHRGITYGNNVEGPYDTEAGRGGAAATKAIMKRQDWPLSSPRHISAIAQPEDIETTHVEHVAPWREQPQPHERSWEDVSDRDEPDEMRDRVLAYHRMHGGAYPREPRQAVHTAVAGDYRYEHRQPESGKVHWVNAYHPDGRRVGDMTWAAHGDHRVSWIAVYDKDDRRKGIATGMWNKAREVDPDVSHNTSEGGQTDAGRSWAQTTASLAMPSEYGDDNTAPPEGEIHRGVSFESAHFHPETHRILHDGAIPAADRAAHLMAHLAPRLEKDKWGDGGVGRHWSTSERTAQGFATHYEHSAEHPWHEFHQDPSMTRVVFHAAPPKASQMITSPRTKMRHDILPTTHGEREVPLRNRAPVTLTGVSWSVNAKDAPWTRHDFPQPIRVKASADAPPAYYHGTSFELPPGHVLTGAGAQEQGSGLDRVYLSTSPKVASHFARQSAMDRYSETNKVRPHVYEVEPSDDVRAEETGHSASSARVKREVPFQAPYKYAQPGPWEKQASSSGDRHVTCQQGHRHWGAYGAAGLLIRHKGEDDKTRYLLQKRSPFVNEPDTWSVPGGAIGKDESPEQGAWREAREEMGSIPRHVTTHHVVKSTDCGDWAYHTVVADAAEHFMPGGRGETQHETAGVGWHTADEIDELRDNGDLHPGFAKSWDAVRRSRGPKTAVSYGRGRAHWKQPPEQRVGRPGEHMYRMQHSDFRDQTLAHGIEPRPSAGMLPDDPPEAVYMTATDRVYHAQPGMGHPGTPEWREAHEGFDHLKISVEGLPLTEDRTFTNPKTGEKPAWMATEHVHPDRIQLHEPGSEHGVSYDLGGGKTELWHPKTAAALYSQRVERIHPRDLLPYAQREAWRMQDPGGRKHISELAENIRQKGYQPRLHGGMSGDTHSYPPSFPITLVHDDDQSWLWNGHHRTFALNEAGYDKPVPVLVKDFRTGKTAALVATDYEGRTGDPSHITRTERGTVPTAAIARLVGVEGEPPGRHRNRQGREWEDFKADIAANGIRNPLFITKDYGEEPRLSEGNHRRDAAVELGLTHVPVEIRYFGHAERQGLVHTAVQDAGVLNSVNPTGSVFVRYTPGHRATAPLGPNMATLAETQGVHPDTPLKVYRGAPPEQKSIVPGDFITDNPKLAADYAGSGKVLSLDTTHGDVLDDRTEPGGGEYIYRPRALRTEAAAAGEELPVQYHSTPYEHGFPYDEWMHVGTRGAALERARNIRPHEFGLPPDTPTHLHAVRLHGRVYPHRLTDEQATYLTGSGYPVRDVDEGLPSGEGYQIFPYQNTGEDEGSTSYLAHRSAIEHLGTEVIPRHPHTAVVTPGSLPPEQQSAFDVEDMREHRRQMLDVAKNPPPGTRVWRGEMRNVNEHPADAASTGMHWSVNPDSIIGFHKGGDDVRRVVWQGVVENHAEQAFPRSHPMWRGKHESYGHEAEVRFRPGAHVKLEGAYTDNSSSPGYLVPQKPERTSPSWQWHPLDRHIEIRHAGHGAADYSDVGIEREAAWAAKVP